MVAADAARRAARPVLHHPDAERPRPAPVHYPATSRVQQRQVSSACMWNSPITTRSVSSCRANHHSSREALVSTPFSTFLTQPLSPSYTFVVNKFIVVEMHTFTRQTL